MRTSNHRKAVIAAAFALAVAAPVSAGMMDAIMDFKKPNMKYGPLELHPFATVTERYDSNIYLVPEDKPTGARVGGGVLGSWITDLNAGLRLGLTLSDMHKFEAGGDVSSLTYSQQPSANNAFHYKFNGGYNYKGPMGLSGRLADEYVNTTDPAFSELVEREQRWQNTGSVAGNYAPEGGKLSFGLDAQQATHKYLSRTLGALLNRYEQTFGGKAAYQVMPKTKVYVSYQRQLIHYNSGRIADNRSHFGRAGVEGDLLPKVKGRLEFGGQYKEYDSAPTAGQPRITRGFIALGQATYNPIERTTVNLGLSRAINESTFGAGRYYTSSNVSLGVSHKLPHKLTGSFNLGWGVDKYPVPTAPTTGAGLLNRRDDLYTQGVNLDYDLQEWVKLGVGYQHRDRWAKNFTDQYNYEDHQGSFRLAVTF